ncbi:MAG TPA: ATP-binding protein [Abditibacteriaceae bacterium]|jgi:signal transduction histidine kinase|nr:ATP-binding protein [Abditibacteriaceae bacterium]
MRGFRRTLFFSHLGLVALTVLLLLFMFRQLAVPYVSEQLRNRLTHNAAAASRLMQSRISDDGFDVYLTQSDLREVQDRLRQQAQSNGIRLVIISRDLQVLADSSGSQSSTRTAGETGNTATDNAEADDSNVSWSTRLEVKVAMQGETNWTVKGSWRDTSSAMTLAMPIRLRRNGEIVGCVVTSSPIFVLTPTVFGLARTFFLFVAAIVALVVVLSFALAQRLAMPVRRLETATRRLAEGDLGSRVLMHRRYLGRGDELDRLTQEFNAMAEKIEAVDLERRAFLADVSHELRTPLTAIKGSAETLRDGAWKSEKMAPRFAETIVTQSDRLIRLVGDLLKLAKLEAATAQNENTQLRLSTRTPAAALCERALSAVRPLFDNRTVTLKLECDAETVRGDEDLLEQLLINLLANAARYSPQGSTTTLIACEDGNETVLQVRDEGCGIAPEHLPKLGQRFYRVEEGRERNSSDTGSGLGLAICRRIALAHGGTLDIESQLEKGTVVTVKLPN